MGVGTMDDFVGALAPLASLANQLGIDFDALAASEAFLTTQGQSASAAATELQAIMTAFIKPSQGMTDALNALGVESGLALIEAEGLQGAVDILSASLDDDAIALGEVFTRAEALKGAMILAGDGAGEFGEKFTDGIDGATDAAADLQNATDAAISDAFMAKIDVLKITLGEGLSGAFRDVQEAALPFLDDMIQWAQDNPELTDTILRVAGGAILFAGSLVILGPMVTALGVGVGLLFSPFMLFIAALIGVAWITDKVAKALGFDGIIDFLIERIPILVGVFGQLRDILDHAWDIAKGLGEQLDVILSKAVGIDFDLPEELVGAGGNTALEIATVFSPAAFLFEGLSNLLGNAEGGDAAAFQPMMVGEDGPERITFPVASSVEANNRQNSDGKIADTINVYANTYEGGRDAARGFDDQITEQRRARG